MKIEIETDSIRGFYWAIVYGNTRLRDGYAKTYQEAEKNALVKLKQIIKDINDEIKEHKIKKYQKKPFKAFRWFGEEYDGIIHTNDRAFYKGTSISNGDWVLPETGRVIVDEFFQKFFEEVK